MHVNSFQLLHVQTVHTQIRHMCYWLLHANTHTHAHLKTMYAYYDIMYTMIVWYYVYYDSLILCIL